ncbi:hypothetical protein BCR36DRAFT_583203 [Piromyces finnis]|uniref:Agd3 deacetylase domain-containing protein n=1 Tax=Piromyces finnis TaxID=1754191 RepID=A0A1Y1VBJ1_9FUNG|nr:hypothetical protein BCR36DRAFT_583203 [Piromyces finnis]|eukprot:ORX50616.1 hypothetical protein BCR36DRAFT_583203 [Piromyces finnis]
METYRLRYPDRASVTWEKHLDEEAELHIKNFLKLRHDPYMFHEGNLRNADFQEVTIGKATGKFGMMQQWVERMVVEVGKYLDWPMISVKMDDLAASYIDRISRASCQPQYTMVIDDDSGIIKEVKVESQAEVKLNIVGDYKAQCRAPLFVMRNVEFNEKHDIQNVEKIGDEPPTAWIILDKAGESKSFKFSKEIKYNDEKFVGKSSGTFFSGFKLYLIIFVGIVILLLAAYFVYGKITGNKSESNSMYHNNQNNLQYQSNPQFQSNFQYNQGHQYQQPQEPLKSYNNNMAEMYNRNNMMGNRSGPTSPISPTNGYTYGQRSDFQDFRKQRGVRNYTQLRD